LSFHIENVRYVKRNPAASGYTAVILTPQQAFILGEKKHYPWEYRLAGLAYTLALIYCMTR